MKLCEVFNLLSNGARVLKGMKKDSPKKLLYDKD